MDELAVSFDGQSFTIAPGLTLLDGLQRAGAPIPASCRSGVCGTCLVKAEGDTVPPPEAQKTLSSEKKKQGYFLACQCLPAGPMEVRLADSARPRHRARVLERQRLAEDVVGIRLERPDGFEFLAGQYAHFHFPDAFVRSYSIASVPADPHLDLHVRRLPGGRGSGWFFDGCQPGDAIEFTEAQGDCCYIDDTADAPLLLVGFGTGVAPLQAIAREALRKGHRQAVYFYQAGLHAGRLYFRDELEALARDYSNFVYEEVILNGEAGGRMRVGDIAKILQTDRARLAGCRVYLCGDGESVLKLRKTLFLAGVPMRNIRADAFVRAKSAE